MFCRPGKPTIKIKRRIPQVSRQVGIKDFRQSGMSGTATSAAVNPSGPVANKNIIASCTLMRNNSAAAAKNMGRTLSAKSNAPIMTGKLLSGDNAKPTTGRKVGAACKMTVIAVKRPASVIHLLPVPGWSSVKSLPLFFFKIRNV